MEITMLKSKIHRAVVTEADLDYVGSITIDEDLMKAANIREYEQVEIANVTNGNRLTTYVMKGEPGSGVICINGAAAHLVNPGDIVIIMAYASMTESQAVDFTPAIVLVNEKNRRL